MLSKCTVMPSILRTYYATLSITSSFPYPKLCEASHNVGQMQMYVHYFDRYVKNKDEHPTIGILLCQEKDDAIVELTLPEKENIYASEYRLYLPDKALLQRKLAEWVEAFEEEQNLLHENNNK